MNYDNDKVSALGVIVFIVTTILVTIVCGCGETNQNRNTDKDLICDCRSDFEKYLIQPYFVNYEYKDENGKKHTFSNKQYFTNENLDSIFQICGILANGETKYYYSKDAPCKNKNGLLEIDQLDSCQLQIDFTSVIIKCIPCKILELDPIAQDIVQHATKYKIMRKNCPKHSRCSIYY